MNGISTPLVSVVIPCFNAARFLGEAIESVLAQSYPRIELIVVDDGSTDGSADVAARYPQVRCIRRPNRGSSAARNTGLLHSTGDYVVFLDADDRLLPGALESNLSRLLEQPDCAFVYGDSRYMAADGTPLPRRSSSPHEGRQHYCSLLRGNYIWSVGAVMYRRSALEAVGGFDPSLKNFEDIELHLRITRRYPACHNNALVHEYRQHEGAKSQQNYASQLRAVAIVYQRQRRWTRHDHRWRDAARHGRRGFEYDYANHLMTQMAADVRRGENWQQTWDGMWTLLRYTPLLPFRRVVEKCGQLLAVRR